MITVYGKETCAYCDRAKTLLEYANLSYEYIDVETEDGMNAMRKQVPSAKTVPQIIIDGKAIGGFDELRKYLKGK